eukprot:CAMPEP_0177653372 /NCGR_PEP_ID=MMETSP0447-20121125/13701_1 /TAXON_ID=0 /ORGANISM="Stygamoeba regulata, Strain BSH-02190019" /LENGTH=300 /DNA_ID=CAMNT_0019156825 /DNA_START=73 /DNA_END=975 /DNA_ORIENTATION=+
MRLIICSKNDLSGCRAVNLIVRGLHKRLPDEQHKVWLLLSDRVGKAEMSVKDTMDLLFFERDIPVYHIFPLLDELPLPSKEEYMKEDITSNPSRFLTFKQLGQLFDFPVEIITNHNVNSPELVERMTAFQPDLMLSCRFQLIFKTAVIQLPKMGIVNIHPGKLPEYCGVQAPFRAMINGEKECGATLHLVDEGIDTGSVIHIASWPIDTKRSMLFHQANLYPLCIAKFVELLPEILEKGGAKPFAKVQDTTNKKYYSFPSQEEFDEFRNKGWNLYTTDDWRELIAPFYPPGLAPGRFYPN